MSLKAFIPSGQTDVTVNGLHQWDYGQKLEIHDDTLPALIEVHFACVGMTEAVVRACNVVQGVAEAAIPDQCLEQTAPIIAYIYEVGTDSGATTKTLILTVTPRPRPQTVGAITPTISDKYTELMGAVTEQVNALKAGNVTVSKALTANTAGYADEAKTAQHATQADSATTATNAAEAAAANWASRAGRLNITQRTSATISDTGLYLVMWKNSAGVFMTDFLFIDDLIGHDVSTTGGYDGASTPGPYYSAYDRKIVVMHSGSIVDVYKIADYSPSVG